MDSNFTVKQIQAGPCFSYILESDGQTVIIDPHITKLQTYRDHFAKSPAKLIAVIDTHTHADHLSSAAIVSGEFHCPIYMSESVVSSLDVRKVADGDVIEFGSAKLDVIPAPGHTDDSIALSGGGCVFTGDVLLIGSVGRTDFQNGSPEDMFDTLAKLKNLPDETIVYPAHDYKDHTLSTIGDEKAGNSFMAEADKQAFAAKARSKILPKPFNMDTVIAANRDGSTTAIEYISPAESHTRLESDDGNWQILDVRRPDEYQAERIENSLHIPLDALGGRLKEVIDSPNRFVLLCRSGVRASMAASILLAGGVADVCVMEGGLKAWQKESLPVVKEKVPVSLERQVRAIAGSLVLIGSLLGLLASAWFFVIPLFVGCGLLFAGLTNSCMMAMLLMKLPYNRRALAPKTNTPAGGACSMDSGPAGGACSMDSPSDKGTCAM